ncbi:MAG: hypothetical protein HFG49_08175 [Lachnospiraceae bacterium]|jgi:hypothetical protein|nr:hypothetical protein [Lachnospiraceae bacterium]
MKVNKTGKKKLNIIGFFVSVLLFFLVIGAFVNGASAFSGKARSEGDVTLRNAIARATVQCYAIEGRYPPSVEYLEEHYGIQIDRKRYHVFYEGFASNIMPDITVIPAEE